KKRWKLVKAKLRMRWDVIRSRTRHSHCDRGGSGRDAGSGGADPYNGFWFSLSRFESWPGRFIPFDVNISTRPSSRSGACRLRLRWANRAGLRAVSSVEAAHGPGSDLAQPGTPELPAVLFGPNPVAGRYLDATHRPSVVGLPPHRI